MCSRAPKLVVGAMVFFAAGCFSFERGERLPDAAPAPTSDGGTALRFGQDVHPVLVSRCGSCHSPQGSASSTDWVLTGDVASDYEDVLDFIDIDAAGSSRLLSKGRGEGHGGGASLSVTDSDYELIANWIAQGAQP